MEDYRTIIGENIRRHRKRHCLTQEDLAELTGIQPSSVGKNRACTVKSKLNHTVALCGCIENRFTCVVY